jgi:putative polyhydroxyalkanoate system protein
LADIHIVREHGMGLARARALAFLWAEVAERKLEMQCSYEEGHGADVVRFRRQGAHGELKVTKDHFELDARLGLLLGVFKHQIETEIVRNLDELLAHEDPLHAFEHRVARHDAKHAAKHGHVHKPAPRKAPARRKP